jgi:hypothetical protein
MPLKVLGGIVVGLGVVAVAVMVTVGSSAASKVVHPAIAGSVASTAARPVVHSDLTSCTPDQLVPGGTTHAFGAASLGTRSEYVTQSLHNTGAACTFGLPTSVAAAAATGAFTSVPVTNAGQATSFHIAEGATVSVVIGGWWQIPGMQPAGTTPLCHGSIANVTRVTVPLASGDLAIALGVTWPRICTAPASMSITLNV